MDMATTTHKEQAMTTTTKCPRCNSHRTWDQSIANGSTGHLCYECGLKFSEDATTTTTITFHGEPGWRFAFVEDFTIREVEDGFDIFQDCDGDDVRIACTDTLDEAVLYVETTMRTTF